MGIQGFIADIPQFSSGQTFQPFVSKNYIWGKNEVQVPIKFKTGEEAQPKKYFLGMLPLSEGNYSKILQDKRTSFFC